MVQAGFSCFFSLFDGNLGDDVFDLLRVVGPGN